MSGKSLLLTSSSFKMHLTMGMIGSSTMQLYASFNSMLQQKPQVRRPILT
jgi:hypothetical protein